MIKVVTICLLLSACSPRETQTPCFYNDGKAFCFPDRV